MSENEIDNHGAPEGGGASSEETGRTFTGAEVSKIVQQRLAQDRRARGGASPPTSGGGHDANQIATRVAAFMNHGYSADEAATYAAGNYALPAPPPRGSAPRHMGAPVTGSGAPANPSHVITEDTPILRMTDADRIALRRKIGDAAYVERMRKEFRENNVRVTR